MPFYKLCADRRLGVYFVHATARNLKAAGKKFRRLSLDYPDVSILQIDRKRSRNLTKRFKGK
jgi:hypothetical protein